MSERNPKSGCVIRELGQHQTLSSEENQWSEQSKQIIITGLRVKQILAQRCCIISARNRDCHKSQDDSDIIC